MLSNNPTSTLNKKLIITYVGRHIFITDTDGLCINCSNPIKIGQKIDLPLNLKNNLRSKKLEVYDQNQIIVPVKFNKKTRAFLLLDETFSEHKKHQELAKNLAELYLAQYLESQKPTLDLIDSFLSKLVRTENPDFTYFETEAQTLGYNFDIQRLAIIIKIKNFSENYLNPQGYSAFDKEDIIKKWKNKIESSISGFFTLNRDLIIAYIGKDKFLVLKAVSDKDNDKLRLHMKKSYGSIFGFLINELKTEIIVGFGNAYSGIKKIPLSFHEADLAMELGPKIMGQNTSYFYGDLGILQVLAEINENKRSLFVRKIIGKLNDQDLLKTLEVYLAENLNLAKTARRLRIHRNTAIYRLNQISAILGADPRIFRHAVTLKIALMIRRYLC